MLYLKTQSTTEPSAVIVENLPEDVRVVRLADNIAIVQDEEGFEHYEYDEVVFEMPYDRHDTAAEIEADFAAWWEFGQQEPEETTIEQRLSDLEEIVMALIEG